MAAYGNVVKNVMLFSVVRLDMLWRRVPVSISMEPPGRVGLFLRCHASLKKA